ncbi:MAG: acireductone synthase [Gammaproteobacteria bacterium]|nr:acireductone synthase [Gammaproteobacteria bacterium]MDH5651706.1 acireductone synthase [Gammaproteobacteria bacterium]
MIKAVVTDIEGTTTALTFVHDVLFPYARKQIAAYVRGHAQEPAVSEQLAEVCRIVGKELSPDEVIEQLIAWIDADQKITPLKALQGMIWQTGYAQGDFTGHVYEDAVRNLQQWHERGIKLYVFSSGSVQAQKLLFGYSDAGDMLPLFSGYFDTNIGNKREAASYQAIAEQINQPADQILFLSDIVQELDAAAAAGMHTIWLVRDAEPDSTASHRQVASFDQIIVD